MGFSDARLAELAQLDAKDVRSRRSKAGVMPVYKRIDTCREFSSETPICIRPMRSAADAECEAIDDREKSSFLAAANRIGQGIEFDYCCVHACYALSDAGYETIMINCNPETFRLIMTHLIGCILNH